MQAKKLLKLADGLEELIPKRNWKKYFDLDSWAEAGWEQKVCGTTACAMGWATVIFPRSKLKLVKADSHWEAFPAMAVIHTDIHKDLDDLILNE